MPPRGHSGSSRSSSSRSSSSRSSSSRSSSSFRSSSSSRSSGSFSRSPTRGPSSHSSSSRSSVPNFSFGRNTGSRSSVPRGPSSHSSSSRTSVPRTPGAGQFSPRPQPVQHSYRPSPPRRPRINQPLGYRIAGALAPKYYYGKTHDYVYYPNSWTDSGTGTYYESGYYDENGTRYDNVAVENNGKYENVICHCDYCDQDIILNLDANEDVLTDLKCPNCTAPLTIKSALDEYLNDDSASVSNYAADTGVSYSGPARPKKKRKIWPWVIAILVALGIYGNSLDSSAPQSSYTTVPQQGTQIQESVSAPTQSEDIIYLKNIGGNADTYASSDTATKILRWDADADSYYEETSDCWLWYNTDVTPSLWQYWYEGISSNYESGWMEHDSSGWAIETTPGTWIDLPSRYDTSKLWYIDG